MKTDSKQVHYTLIGVFAIGIIVLIIFGMILHSKANADGLGCHKLEQLICNDIEKTYSDNSYDNIAIIQRASILRELYHEKNCNSDQLVRCISKNLKK
jgi:hypothetical protein